MSIKTENDDPALFTEEDEPRTDTLFSFPVPQEGIDRIDTWLVSCCEGFSRARIQGLLKAGRISVSGRTLTRAIERVLPGEVVTISVPPPVPAIPQPEDLPLSIIYEDDDLLVIDKPAGLVVHPAPGHLTGTLVNALLHHCPNLSGIGGVARPGIVHRLDQDTSGLIVVAKSEAAMKGLTRAFADHVSVHKTYHAIAHGVPTPPEGRIENLIGRSPFDRKKMAVVDRNGKRAVTNYKVLTTFHAGGSDEILSLIECRIETGRTHQIRVHLAACGCPIVGDRVYGRSAADGRIIPTPTRQLLHARRLELRHPVTGVPLVFEAPPPADFKAIGPTES